MPRRSMVGKIIRAAAGLASSPHKPGRTRRGAPRFAPAVAELEAREVPATFYVAGTGSDAGAGTQASPFRTIQRAVDQAAAAGDEVRVAAGVYTYTPGQDGGRSRPSGPPRW